MAEVMNTFGQGLSTAYQEFSQSMPQVVQSFITLFALSVLIMLYAIFIWKLYRFVAKKNLIKLNLNKYNRLEHPTTSKLLAGILYFLEYIVLLPFFIFFWYAVFTLFLLFLSEGLSTSAILLISAAIITAVRLTAYYKEDAAKEIAKLLPFTLLGIAITKPGFFNIARMFESLKEIPVFFENIFGYFILILIMEIILRTFDLFSKLLKISSKEEPEIKSE